jgi:hypothetical protein
MCIKCSGALTKARFARENTRNNSSIGWPFHLACPKESGERSYENETHNSDNGSLGGILRGEYARAWRVWALQA